MFCPYLKIMLLNKLRRLKFPPKISEQRIVCVRAAIRFQLFAVRY